MACLGWSGIVLAGFSRLSCLERVGHDDQRFRTIPFSSTGSVGRGGELSWPQHAVGSARPCCRESGPTTQYFHSRSSGGVAGTPIAGFTIGGVGAKRVLVRAIGPSLSAFGLSGTLA
jgi:hypothetical protein